jgi:aminopeptidase-like protein
VLNLSDGDYTVLDISDKSGLEFECIQKAAKLLLEHNLLKRNWE